MGNTRTGKLRKRSVTICLDDKEYESLQKVAEEANLKPTSYIRTLLNKRIQYLEQSSKRQGEVFYDYTV
jgi:hypothetical protein|tara:strand:+ start:1307 stop:1513 length:207 start_codon:yes stop_codon:yes gene_type:complete